MTIEKKTKFSWLTWSPTITFSIVFLIYLIASLLKLDPDFGWHLKSGEYFLANGIPGADIFTYTASNFPWINHEWLSDIFISAIYSFSGYLGLSVVYAMLWTLVMWLVGRKVHNLVIIFAVLATIPFAGVRAITWSVLGLAILITIVNSNRRYWWFIPPLFLVWANVHGSFVIGFAYLIYQAFWKRSWRLVGLLAVGILLTFVNPYGPGMYMEVLRTVTDSSLRGRISEWAPFVIPWMTIPFVLMWASAFTLTGLKDWRKYLGLDVVAFFAGVANMRSLVLFVILAVGITGERLKVVAATIPKNLDKSRRRLVVVVASVIAIFVFGTIAESYWGFSIDREASSPKNAVAYLKQNPCKGRLFNHYNYGGYLIWKLPSHKVYIDGRMPSWEQGGRKYMDDYLNTLNDPDFRRQEFNKYGVRCVIMHKKEHLTEFIKPIKNDGWKTVAEDRDSILMIAP